ncbi:uncharacterized protein RCO7_07893 [Rhynchosporium graminicola]|uniref:Uncharacterized protein n=1 Tax=Rhynchosporium graminicola TaxID=2792576 RepID=A0A1E1KND8_9HELO|nr:uncharacterized protein RCO7_07893 [Rhynchosporium commune]
MSRYGKSIAISKIYDSQGALVAVLVMSLEPVGLQVKKDTMSTEHRCVDQSKRVGTVAHSDAYPCKWPKLQALSAFVVVPAESKQPKGPAARPCDFLTWRCTAEEI